MASSVPTATAALDDIEPSPGILGPSPAIPSSSPGPLAMQPPPAPQPAPIPIVKLLQVESINEVLAAHLATSLLSIVLFLKNQIPLPIPQLTRIAGKNSKPKAAKQRTELLTAFDILSSHLPSTFASLAGSPPTVNHPNHSSLSTPTQVHLAILLGPTLGTAKSRVFLCVDQFGVKPLEEKDEGGAESEESDESQGDSSEDGPGDSDTASEDEGDEEDEAEAEDGDQEAAFPTPATPPKPTPPPRPFEPYIQPQVTLPAPGKPNPTRTPSSSSYLSENSPQHSRVHFQLKPTQPQPQLKSTQPQPNRPTQPQTHAQQQKILKSAERLLSHSLAEADAEGYGFNNDMAPTQTHILLRAPRSFAHPAWTPRQNVSRGLELGLREFLGEVTSSAHANSSGTGTDCVCGSASGSTSADGPNATANADTDNLNGQAKKIQTQRKKARSRPEGVFITAGPSTTSSSSCASCTGLSCSRSSCSSNPRTIITTSDPCPSSNPHTPLTSPGPKPIEDDSHGDTDAEDEMIWWSWDGRLVGFSDW
ncbi:hypothetical protein FA15DRAFT_756679 [Coprinopsis marcescibilis]|uniref:Uncharacterized protein n=1 Tax=Coprinopsis marcescibilis TaxID=230819 RepID=A0A5C3KUA4_COPMA|nr:hypothetical protein FA15DRAFT_756679 [Coprinopsis marcescibilis]